MLDIIVSLGPVPYRDGVLIDTKKPVISLVTESSGTFQNQSAFMKNLTQYPTINDVSISNNFSKAPLTLEWWMKNSKWNDNDEGLL